MTVYLVTGRLGGGKTLCSVGRLVQYLERGRPCASNLDLDLTKLPAAVQLPRVVRLPDRPSADDLYALGVANDTSDEEKNGLLLLDECGVIFNSREWNDKGRQPVIDWLLHSRKLGWDVLLIVQAASLLDKQLREALCEMLVVCKRLDRLKVPFIGSLGRLLTFGLWSGKMPRVHVASVRYGLGPDGIASDTWWFRGVDLFGIYDTKQRFRRDYADGPCSLIDWRGYVPPVVERPKLPPVQAAMRLRPDRRVPFLRDLGLCTA